MIGGSAFSCKNSGHSGGVVRISGQTINRFSWQAEQRPTDEGLYRLRNGVRGYLRLCSGPYANQCQMPKIACASSATCRAASMVLAVMVRWPIFRPTRASSLPYR